MNVFLKILPVIRSDFFVTFRRSLLQWMNEIIRHIWICTVINCMNALLIIELTIIIWVLLRCHKKKVLMITLHFFILSKIRNRFCTIWFPCETFSSWEVSSDFKDAVNFKLGRCLICLSLYYYKDERKITFIPFGRIEGTSIHFIVP